MDPEQTLRDLMEHFHDGNRVEAVETLKNLLKWCTYGGHLPRVQIDSTDNIIRENLKVHYTVYLIGDISK